jgi:hypothetical protein
MSRFVLQRAGDRAAESLGGCALCRNGDASTAYFAARDTLTREQRLFCMQHLIESVAHESALLDALLRFVSEQQQLEFRLASGSGESNIPSEGESVEGKIKAAIDCIPSFAPSGKISRRGPRFFASGLNVYSREGEAICRARSSALATRIAEALNDDR